MSLDERIHELYIQVATAKDPDEVCQTLGLLRAALRAQIEHLNESVAEVIRNTPYRTTHLRLTDPSQENSRRKPPTGDYSAA